MEMNNEDLSRINAATYANGYNPLLGRSSAVGYRPSPFRYADRGHYPNIGEEFLINSYTTRFDIENHGSLEQYTTESELIMLSMMERRDYSGMKKVSLPNSIPLELSLGESILRRRSISTYTGDYISLQHLATVLRAAYGVSSQAIVRSNVGSEVSIKLRTVPSGGGLYPLSLYIVAQRVNKLPRGIYEYSVNDDSLYQVSNASIIDDILKTYAASDDDISFSRANFICFFVGTPWKSMRKYGNKGLRFMLQEIGSVSQNIHLTNVALGLGSTDCAAYYENEINELLGFDGVNQSILHSIVSGIFG
jgi:SagB-type dehydrogenase family enzyme